MRVLLFLGFLLIATPAFALSDSFIDFCLTTDNPKACLRSAAEFTHSHQLQQQQAAYDAQRELARIQANGMAMFGTGPALINGMNQHLSNMRVQTPPVQIAPIQIP